MTSGHPRAAGAQGRSPTSAPAHDPPRLDRDRLTLSLLSVPAMFGWYVYAFGPMASLLRTEQGTSRAVSGLHGTALAVGSVVAGGVAVRLTRRFGRRAVVVGAVITCASGLLLLVLGHQLVWTLLAALVIGSGGVLAMNTMTTILTLHHRASGASAVSEAHAVAPTAGLLAPLAVGALVARGVGWRPAVAVSIALGALCVVLMTRVPRTAALDGRTLDGGAPGARGGMPTSKAFWGYCVVTVLGVSVEFSTSFWATDLLRDSQGAGPATATAAPSALILGLAAGRALAGRLALQVRSEVLLGACLPVALAGWLLLWLSPSVPAALAGLLVTGLGYAGMYPLGATLMAAASGDRADRSYALASMGNGLAIGVTPFVLGALADATGLHSGFLLIPALLLVATAAMLVASRRPG